MGPFSVFTVFVGVISRLWCGRQNTSSSFSAHGKIGNFIIIIIYHLYAADSSGVKIQYSTFHFAISGGKLLFHILLSVA